MRRWEQIQRHPEVAGVRRRRLLCLTNLITGLLTSLEQGLRKQNRRVDLGGDGGGRGAKWGQTGQLGKAGAQQKEVLEQPWCPTAAPGAFRQESWHRSGRSSGNILLTSSTRFPKNMRRQRVEGNGGRGAGLRSWVEVSMRLGGRDKAKQGELRFFTEANDLPLL